MSENTGLTVQRQKVASIRKLLDDSKTQIAMALPKHMTADRMLRVAMTSIQRNPKLLDCTQQSLIACVMTAAQLGLEVDGVTGQAYLVPYGKVCTLIPGYQGLMSLSRRSGEISTITVDVVYEKDTYRVLKGLSPVLEHTPYSKDDPGDMVAVYAVCRLKDGGIQFEWMWKWQVDRIRKRSMAANNGPWVSDYEAMSKKTVIRQLCKMLPKSVELSTAIGLDERAEIGIDQNLIVPEEVIDVQPEDEPAKPKSKLDEVADKYASAEPKEEVAEEKPPSELDYTLWDTLSQVKDELGDKVVKEITTGADTATDTGKQAVINAAKKKLAEKKKSRFTE